MIRKLYWPGRSWRVHKSGAGFGVDSTFFYLQLAKLKVQFGKIKNINIIYISFCFAISKFWNAHLRRGPLGGLNHSCEFKY